MSKSRCSKGNGLSSVLASPNPRLVVQDHIQQRIVYFEVAVVADEAQLPEFVHERAHTRPRGADNLGERLVADFRHDRLRFPLLAGKGPLAADKDYHYHWKEAPQREEMPTDSQFLPKPYSPDRVLAAVRLVY